MRLLVPVLRSSCWYQRGSRCTQVWRQCGHLGWSAATRGAPCFGQGKRGRRVGEPGQYGGVVGLLWDDVKCFFDPDVMGSLPDVRVPDTSVGDWQVVLDLIAEKGWKCQYSEGGTVLPVPRAEAVLSRPADAECPDLRVWPTPDVLAIFRFRAADEVDFDVDLRELQGQDRLDVFCGFLREIGRRLGKPVLMDPEGDECHPVLGFDGEADRVVVLADSLSPPRTATRSSPA